MRRYLVAFCLFAFTLALSAQTPTTPKSKPAPPQVAPQGSQVVKDLPVRKVVLYKNGVGYFEHAGTVSGNQRVAIDFTSAQLNDVLQSLTVLDEGGGRIAGVNYNSTTPIEQQLQKLALGLKDYPAAIAVYQAIRGQRVEVTGAGASLTGKLVNIEFRRETDKAGQTTEDHYFLIVVTDAGALRMVQLTDALYVRMLDPALQKQFANYLDIIASAQNQQVRHLQLEDRGEGQRQLRVSYISAVPVWKATYRMVFPRVANGGATVQGWAVVDNTVGSDWDNVQLSLVAGAPQSFTQPLSQPIYSYRPEIPIAIARQNAPQTHEAAEMMNDQLTAPIRIPKNIQTGAMLSSVPPSSSFGVAGMEGFGGSTGGVMGGVYRPSDAIQQGDVTTNAFDDFFEYALTQPVTIHKNESAMVPILQQDLPAEHVTLWSEKEPTPLRAVWLENKSNLTLDSGSFSIFESGEFAGEGLLDPIHPGEKRLLSYAADQAVKVHRGGLKNARTLHHIALHDGVLVEQTSEVTDSTYTVSSAASEARTVIVEHARRPGAELNSEPKPTETTPTAYRFKLVVEPHQSVDLRVSEKATLSETIRINPNDDRSGFLVAISKFTPALEEKLRPLIDAETALSNLNRKIQESEQKEKTLADDEARARENLTALKGNDAGKRFVAELNQAEDDIAAARKDRAGLEKERDAARARVESIIAQLSFDTDLDVVTEGTQPGTKALRR